MVCSYILKIKIFKINNNFFPEDLSARAEAAENQLGKMRAQGRSTASTARASEGVNLKLEIDNDIK